jgi:hypothetical protein
MLLKSKQVKMMTENGICTKCGIPITSATRFYTDICLTCHTKTFEIEFSQAQREAHLLQTFGENPRSYPPYALVAETVHANFPGTNMKLITEGNSPRFELYDETNLLMTIDSKEWTYSSGQRGGTWSSIKEGSLESISMWILRAFAELDYAVFNPQGAFGDELVKGERRLVRTKNLTLRQCVKCKERGQIKKVFFGTRDSILFKPEYSIYGGDKRMRFSPFYKCLSCGWTK